MTQPRPTSRSRYRLAALLAALSAGCLLPAACASSSGFDVESSSSDYVRFDYEVAKTDRNAMLRAAESHCQRSFRHARQIDLAYLRGTDGGELWRTVTYACTDR
ncbi:hypothetical protein ABMY26_01405 [Azospirillum sp. HJ39]|uniref:hypothetical protein n=1 Tax=Azospirillum sp. HJ39 TaxID=3159496 RepID=UPI003557771E